MNKLEKREQSLAESVANELSTLIVVDKKYNPGDKIPNENSLADAMHVSRTTLREAIRILVAGNVLEIKRGKGTFVTDLKNIDETNGVVNLNNVKVNLTDLYEMRILFEPQAAYLAAIRGTEKEIERIIYYGELTERMIKEKGETVEADQFFHRSIVKATHNEFMEKLMPILYKAISSSTVYNYTHKDVLQDHRSIMDFFKSRDPEGAKAAMQLHIIHNMRNLDIK